MKINFIFPMFIRKPGGGTKIMYEYARRLSDRGYDVVIYHALKMSFVTKPQFDNCKALKEYNRLKFFRRLGKRPKWIFIPSKIKCLIIPFVSDDYILDGDIVITTWWASALEMGKLRPSKGLKINFIQGYENWLGHDHLLHQSYNIPGTTNVVIAKYLYNIVSIYTSNRIEVIENSIDSIEFFIKMQPALRNKYSISMMYSEQELKGSVYGLAALDILKSKYPHLEANIFSVRSKPDGLPKWIKYYKNPSDLCDIYNRSSIFISTSIQEGWGLTPMEAMACGCACVATKIDGHMEYMKDKYNCLFSIVKDVSSIVDNVSCLIENTDLRLELIDNGIKTVNQYYWEDAITKFDSILKDIVSN